MKSIRKPNFFIVGAPRSGTTALYTYLQRHPDVFMPEYKEPHFFATDLRARWMDYYKNKKKYESLFEGRKEKRLGEASVYYLASRVAARKIKKYNPRAKIIIMLRSPRDVIDSIYQMRRFGQEETVGTLHKALILEKRRRKKLWTSKNSNLMPESFWYTYLVDYAPQVERFFSQFDRKNVHIIIFDDFVSKLPEVYNEVLRFLGVDSSFKTNFEAINENRLSRSIILQKLIMKPPAWVRRLGYQFFPLARPVYKLLLFLNSNNQKRQTLDKKTRIYIDKKMSQKIVQLEKLIGRDLSGWYAGD